MTKKQKLNTLFIVVLLVGLLSWSLSITSMKAHAASIYYVKEGGTEDCSDWDHACDLQTALSIAEEGDEIWVAAGTYYPGIEREDTFQLISGVKIFGGFPENGGGWEKRNWKTHQTILSGDIGTGQIFDNSYHVVTGSGVDDSAVLDGFIITGGNADKANLHDYGGGMYNNGGNPTLRNLIFQDNTALKGGGGMYNTVGSNPTLLEVSFISNSAQDGGGMYNWYCSPRLENVNFAQNTAEKNGGGIYNVGGSPSLEDVNFTENTAKHGAGIYNKDSVPSLKEVNFTENTAEENGGGIYNKDSNPKLTGVNFTENTAEYGGGMYNTGSSPILVEVDFIGNYGEWKGGGMLNDSGSPNLTKVTFRDNSTEKDGGGMYNNNSNPILTEVEFIDNRAHQGGGISNHKGNLTLTKVTFKGNVASGEYFTYGGGMYTQGSGAAAMLTDVSFINNSTQGTNARGGGIYYKEGSIELEKVTFNGNSVNGEDFAGGGGMYIEDVGDNSKLTDVSFINNSTTGSGEGNEARGGGIYYKGGKKILLKVTFSGNSVNGEDVAGGGMYNEEGPITMENVTFSGNQANGTKKAEGAGLYSRSAFRLFNVTLTGNFAGEEPGSGGAIFNATSEEAHLINSILWGNKPDQIGGMKADVTYSIVEGGYTGTGNLDEDPKLLPLADNGGFTLTHALPEGSPAIDKGSKDTCPKTDQREVKRPIDGDGDGVAICDIGAFEFEFVFEKYTLFLPLVLR